MSEESEPVKIRELAKLLTDEATELTYETHSQSVEASGMASYLRSVNFSMTVKQVNPGIIQVAFTNEVKVARPWFTPDFLFAPIARHTCVEKLDKVSTALLAWMQNLPKGN